jgi:hypothetical protein
LYVARNKRRRSDSVPDPRQLTAVFDNLRQKRATKVGPTRSLHIPRHIQPRRIRSYQTTTFNLHPNKPKSSHYPQIRNMSTNQETPPPLQLAQILSDLVSLRVCVHLPPLHLPNHLLTQMRTTGPNRRSRPRIRAPKHHSFDDKRRRGG